MKMHDIALFFLKHRSSHRHLHAAGLIVTLGILGTCHASPLDFAETLADGMPQGTLGDRRKSDLLAEIVRTTLLQHDLARAERVARRIPDWQRGSTLADVAVATARSGKSEKGVILLNEAVAWKQQIAAESKQGTLGWTIARIDQHVIAARDVLGLAQTPEQIPEDVWRNADARVVAEHLLAVPLAKRDHVWAEAMTNRDFAVQSGFSLALLHQAEQTKTLSEAQADWLVSNLDQTLTFVPVGEQVGLLTKLAGVLRKGGFESRAIHTSDRAVALARGLPPSLARIRSLAQASMTVSDHKPDEGLLHEAVETINQCSLLEKPIGYAEVAKIQATAGDKKNARQNFMKALELAASITSRPARCDRGVRVCLRLEESGLTIDEEMQTVLKQSVDRMMRNEPNMASENKAAS